MKKLMIAAAAVAMIGAAGAETLVYDFTAKVKTTKAKKSSVQTTTFYLGTDGKGKFWYEEAEDAGEFADELWTTKIVDGEEIPSLKVDNKNILTWPKDYSGDKDQDKKDLAYLADKYGKKSAGKWCCIVKIQESGCYRVEATETYKSEVEVDDCCSELGNVYRFGAINYAKATKVSAYFSDSDIDDTDFYDFEAIGHGTWKDKLFRLSKDDDYVGGISTLSGSLVGVLPAPDCASCCKSGSKAIAFDCDDEAGYAVPFKFAYGTFTLKYNASKTKKANN